MSRTISGAGRCASTRDGGDSPAADLCTPNATIRAIGDEKSVAADSYAFGGVESGIRPNAICATDRAAIAVQTVHSNKRRRQPARYVHQSHAVPPLLTDEEPL